MKNKNSSHLPTSIALNVLLISTLIIVGSFNTWRQAQIDVQEFIDNIEQSIHTLGKRVKDNKEQYIDLLAHPPQALDNILVPIHYYPQTNEFGFNNTIRNSVLLNGTLIGKGRPPKGLSEHNYIFPGLDRIWSRSSPLLLSTDQFYTSYQYTFIYSMKNRVSNASDSQYLGVINTSRYFDKAYSKIRAKMQLKNHGFFVTGFYPDPIDGEYMMSVISPVIINDQHVGDMGIDIPLPYFLALNNLPKDLRQSAHVEMKLEGITTPFTITDSSDFSAVLSLTKRFPVKGLAEVTLTVPPYYLVQKLYDKFLPNLLLILLFNLIYFKIIKSNQEKFLLHTKTITDDLTQIYNRRVIDEPFTQKKIQQTTYSLIVMDANKFKIINDRYGHQEGDNAIQHIAKTLEQYSREHDICIRMGGDEFCVLLPNTELEKAHNIASNLKNKIETKPFSKNGLYVKVAYGVSQKNDNDDFDQTYKFADQALYLNKSVNQES